MIRAKNYDNIFKFVNLRTKMQTFLDTVSVVCRNKLMCSAKNKHSKLRPARVRTG